MFLDDAEKLILPIVGAITAISSAVAAVLAWRTSRSALQLSKAIDTRMQLDALLREKERYEILLTEVRLKRSTLFSFASDMKDDAEKIFASLGNDGVSEKEKFLSDADGAINVAGHAKKLLSDIRDNEPNMRTLDNYLVRNKELSVMRVNIVAMYERCVSLRERASSCRDWRENLEKR